MKTLKIKTTPVGETGIAVGLLGHVQVVMIDDDGTEEDITKGIRTVDVNIPLDDVVTAKVEFYVQELDLEGVKVNE
jgi:hypothetical protein